jgi:hypothetical protein
MAVLYPDNPSDFNNSEGERAVFEALRELSDRYSVFYSVAWLNPRSRRTNEFHSRLQGEADFLLVDPNRGLLVIEVKSGGIRHANRQWYQTNTSTQEEFPIGDPIQQANRSAHFFRQLLGEKIVGSVVRVFHGVWFPSVVFDRQHLPLDVARSMILDARALASPEKAIDEMYEFWDKQITCQPFNKNCERSILKILAPEFGAIPSFRASMEARERQFVRLTKEQARIFEFLDEQDTAVIAGPAGSGKTVMALECARRISDAGGEVVFLCFNAPLRRFLAETHRIPRVQFHTFHSFAGSCVARRDLGYEELEQEFLTWLAGDEVARISNLIIDEAQDFSSDWIEWLAFRTLGRAFAFYDPNQLLYQADLPLWIQNAKCRLTLSRVCRNTQEIARTVARAIGSSKCTAEFAPIGLKPQLYTTTNGDEVKKTVAKLINHHVTVNGLNPSDIVILTAETTTISKLAQPDWPFRVSEEYAQSEVCFTTIRKFKGLEAKVIILLDLDLGRLADIEYRRLFYIACSRAVHELHIVLMKPTNRAIQTAIRIFSDGDKTGNMKSLAFLLAAKLNSSRSN